MEIEIGGSPDEEQNTYYVNNRVIGFNMRFAKKLFRVFERIHATGLAIVKRIVERHGGSVWAEGMEGDGAILYFTLPCEHA